MRVALAQINSTLGDFAGNREKIVSFSARALEKRCDLVVFPELSLMGYLPNDLLERPSIVDEQLKEFAKLQKQIPAELAKFSKFVNSQTKEFEKILKSVHALDGVTKTVDKTVSKIKSKVGGGKKSKASSKSSSAPAASKAEAPIAAEAKKEEVPQA